MLDVKERISDGLNRSRLKLEVRRGIRPLMVVLGGVVVGLLAWAYILGNVGGSVFADKQQVAFAVKDATAIVAKRNEVRVKGVPVGTVDEVRYENGRAIVIASVERKYGAVHNDARAAVRPNTALQDMYLDITDLGHERAGEATKDRPLPEDRTSTSVNVSDVLQVFEPDVRRKLAVVLEDLGAGLQDRGLKLKTAFEQVAPFVVAAAGVTDQLATRSRQTKRLVHNAGLLTEELADRQGALKKLVRDGADTLQTTAQHQAGLDATLAELPPTLNAVDQSFASVRGVLGGVDGAVKELKPTVGELRPALGAVRRISDDARPAVQALRTPVRRLVPLADSLPGLSTALASTITSVRPQIPALNHVTKSADACTKTTAVQKFFQNTSSVFKYADDLGVIIRGDVALGLEMLSAGQIVGRDPGARRDSMSCAPGATLEGKP